jgi:hypothetical protein
MIISNEMLLSQQDWDAMVVEDQPDWIKTKEAEVDQKDDDINDHEEICVIEGTSTDESVDDD